MYAKAGAMKSKARRRVLLAIGGLLLAAILCFGLIQYRVYSLSAPYIVTAEHASKAQAILILGAKVSKNGNPSNALRDRLECGLALYQAGKAPQIVVTGDGEDLERNEVQAMHNYLVEKGVPEDAIVDDPQGLNTYASMYRAKNKYGFDNVLIVTQKYHTGRAIYLGRSLGLTCFAVGTPDSVFRNVPYNHCREALARVKAFLNAEIQHLEVALAVFFHKTI